MQSSGSHGPAVIAYPVSGNSPLRTNHSDMEENVYSSNIGDSNFADDTIEMSGNFFSQVKILQVLFWDQK